MESPWHWNNKPLPFRLNHLGYAQQLFTGMSWTSYHWLHRIVQPCLVLAGRDDTLVPVANAELLARLIPRAVLRTVAGDHLFPVRNAATVAALMRRFLDPQSTTA